MKACVIVFPASNCDRDVAVALEALCGQPPQRVWHQETELPPTDLIVLPGGFSHGDYLRSGAMAARAPIMRDVVAKATSGTPVLGICNGFQILTEAGLLPGALLRNADLLFICKQVQLRVENNQTLFTQKYEKDQTLSMPVAHHDGNYYADAETLARLEGEGQVAFRYLKNPNGAINAIAGITNETGRILGLMPHPERVIEQALGGLDGRTLFESVAEAV